MRLIAFVLGATLGVGCGQEDEASACDTLCNELIATCAYAAFPTASSCVQGCTYNAEQGADVLGELDCILEAECDTFAIVECEHEYGLE